MWVYVSVLQKRTLPASIAALTDHLVKNKHIIMLMDSENEEFIKSSTRYCISALRFVGF